jgi:hypothetical protein
MEFLVNNPISSTGKSGGFTPDEKLDVVRIILMWLNLEQTGRTLWMAARSANKNMKILMRLEPKLLSKEKRTSWLCKGKMINSMLIANDFINELPAGNSEETKDMKVSFMYTT